MVPKLSPLIAALRTLMWMEQNNASVPSLEQAAEGVEHELRAFIRREIDRPYQIGRYGSPLSGND